MHDFIAYKISRTTSAVMRPADGSARTLYKIKTSGNTRLTLRLPGSSTVRILILLKDILLYAYQF